MNIDKFIIASDVHSRDGIGIEFYSNDNLVVEIFRDNTEMKRTVNIFQGEVSLEYIKECIAIFKKEIPWDFIDYDKLI
jgi:hypothetical protein